MLTVDMTGLTARAERVDARTWMVSRELRVRPDVRLARMLGSMALGLIHLTFCRLLRWLALSRSSSAAKVAPLLVLRHEVAAKRQTRLAGLKFADLDG